MRIILASLFATTLLATASRADVFIYRGIGKVSADLVSGALFGKGLNVFIVVDYSGAQIGTIVFGRINGGKHFASSSASTQNFASAPLPKGRTASFFINGTNSEVSPTNFNLSALLFRGTNQSLLIRKVPIATLANRPNVLKGSGVSGHSNSTSTGFNEQHFGLTFQGAATIRANNASQTVDQAVDDLIAGLLARGYTSF